MKIETKFFIMLIFLSALMGAGTIIPGFLKLKALEEEEATNYLKDRSQLLNQDVERARNVLEKAGVIEVDSYISRAIADLAEKYKNEEPDPRVSSFVVDEEGAIVISWTSSADIPSATEIAAIVRLNPEGYSKYKGFEENWNIEKLINKNWNWRLVTLMSDDEMYRESWGYFWFVISVSSAVLIAVLLFYFMLTGRVRDRFTATIDKIDKYRGAEIEKFIEVDGSDEIGVLQESINSMIQKIGDEIETRKQTEQALELAKDEAEEANRAKSMFLANMSHEIRNPLNAIVGFSEVLEKTKLDVKQKDYAENIARAGKILTSTLSDVLDISKIESGATVISNEVFDVRNEIHSAFALFSLQGDEKGLDMQCDIDEEVPTQLLGDKTHVIQILTNLLQNAIKFTKQGSVSLKVHVISESADYCRLGIAVIDTGVGIKEDEQRWVFETFSQASSTNPISLSGVGLGLSIVKKLVTLLGGEISLTSKPDLGSRFLIELPFLKPKAKQAQSGDQLPTRTFGLQSLTVLIVDDDVLNQAYISEVLREHEIGHLKAGNGKEAIAALEANSVDIVLMDIRMPVMGGVEAMKYIRQKMTAPNNAVPIIVLTANVFEEDIDEYLEAGANDCINKPARSEIVISTIQKVLETAEPQKLQQEVTI
ncbi:MAG: response regulator [Acidiferrobacterales bacterium]|nr:response regulator [Acidiferrobacterales bacterium]